MRAGYLLGLRSRGEGLEGGLPRPRLQGTLGSLAPPTKASLHEVALALGGAAAEHAVAADLVAAEASA